jgi:LysM repeat protein
MKKKVVSFAVAAGLLFSAGGQAFASAGDDIINTGDNYLGKPYRYGSSVGSTSSFDCSSFTSLVFSKHGVNLPRSSSAQAQVGTPVSKSDLQKGDLVFYDTNYDGVINHVAIYAGGGKMLGAQSSTGVAFTDAFSPYYWGDRYVTARRVIEDKKEATKVVENASQKTKSETSHASSQPTETKSSNVHIVRSGDTLWGISLSYKITVSKIMSLNNLSSSLIFPGQSLKVGGDAVQKTETKTKIQGQSTIKKSDENSNTTYTIKSGDTLWEISKDHGITVNQLMNANDLNSSLIFPGEKLVIPN